VRISDVGLTRMAIAAAPGGPRCEALCSPGVDPARFGLMPTIARC
jgi:hypothetical protein